MAFQKAQRKNAKLRVAITGASGSGKTTCAMMLAAYFGTKIAGVDSEHGSMEFVVGEPGVPDFDHENLDDHTVQSYLSKIEEAAAAGYEVLVIDSYSHSWKSAMQIVDNMGGPKGWKVVTPLVDRLVAAIVNFPGHVICTIRSRMEHSVEKDEKTGKTGMKKLGLGPVARPDTEYEFSVVLDVTREGAITVSKSRCRSLQDVYTRDTDIPKIAKTLKAWLESGAPVSPVALFAERIRFASAQETLTEIVKEIHGALQSGAISKEDAATLKPTIIAKKRELEGASE